MPNSSPHHVKLTVAYVRSGGNARSGKYAFSYTPDFVVVDEKNTVLSYSLSDETDDRFSIYSYAVCDPTKQIENIKLEGGVLSMTNSCTENNQLIMLSVLVKDSTNGDIIDCDPEVTNLPPPE